MDPALSVLRSRFGYPAFRPGQRELIDALLHGRDVLGVLPTGGGKSLCYQIPALLLPGPAIVVSPLISLMEDQTAGLARRGIPAACIHSGVPPAEKEGIFRRVRNGGLKLLYVSPERLLTADLLRLVSEVQLSILAVDEAHCISQWGKEFRPAYRKIRLFLDQLPVRPPVAALTASASFEVRSDIRESLGLMHPLTLTAGFDRPNLYFAVKNAPDRLAELRKLLQTYGNSCGLIYAMTRKTCEMLARSLQREGFSVRAYHGGLSAGERQQIQDDWLAGRVRCLAATSAFGMGIDKPDVRYVIHFQLPLDLESYYQEAGRAGRDGRPAECLLLTDGRDFRVHNYFLSNMKEEAVRRDSRLRLREMEFYASGTACLRKTLLAYFGEERPDFCGNCSFCRSRRPDTERSPSRSGLHGTLLPRTDSRTALLSTAGQTDPERQLLLARLRALRLRIAKENGLLPHRIFSDAVLAGMADALPDCYAKLFLVEGAGVVRPLRYGREFLEEIRQWKRTHPE